MNRNEILERIVRTKSRRRRRLARLPFKKKIEILLELQKMAEGIKKSKGEGKHHLWMK